MGRRHPIVCRGLGKQKSAFALVTIGGVKLPGDAFISQDKVWMTEHLSGITKCITLIPIRILDP
jgi:hypothetical protein